MARSPSRMATSRSRIASSEGRVSPRGVAGLCGSRILLEHAQPTPGTVDQVLAARVPGQTTRTVHPRTSKHKDCQGCKPCHANGDEHSGSETGQRAKQIPCPSDHRNAHAEHQQGLQCALVRVPPVARPVICVQAHGFSIPRKWLVGHCKVRRLSQAAPRSGIGLNCWVLLMEAREPALIRRLPCP